MPTSDVSIWVRDLLREDLKRLAKEKGITFQEAVCAAFFAMAELRLDLSPTDGYELLDKIAIPIAKRPHNEAETQ